MYKQNRYLYPLEELQARPIIMDRTQARIFMEEVCSTRAMRERMANYVFWVAIVVLLSIIGSVLAYKTGHYIDSFIIQLVVLWCTIFGSYRSTDVDNLFFEYRGETMDICRAIGMQTMAHRIAASKYTINTAIRIAMFCTGAWILFSLFHQADAINPSFLTCVYALTSIWLVTGEYVLNYNLKIYEKELNQLTAGAARYFELNDRKESKIFVDFDL